MAGFRHRLGNASWQEVREFMVGELQNYGVRDLGSEFDLVTVRKWLELWIRVDELDLMNVMRWMKGADEATIAGFYDWFGGVKTRCECDL